MTTVTLLPHARTPMNETGLRSVLAMIDNDPGRYYEGVWLGTAADHGTRMGFSTFVCLAARMPVERLLCEDPTGASIDHAAKAMLGLTAEQADALFTMDPDTTVAGLKQRIAEVLGVTV